MLAIFTCSLYRGLLLVVNKLEAMLHHIGKALWNLPGGHDLLFLMAALLLTGRAIHAKGAHPLYCPAVGWAMMASREQAKIGNPLKNPEILSCK